MTHAQASERIVPAPSGIVAVVGSAAAGPTGEPVTVADVAACAALFGAASPVTGAVRAAFDNGADRVVVVRIGGAGDDALTADAWYGPAGLDALAHAPDVDLVVLVPPHGDGDVPVPVIAAAARRCVAMGALLLVDAPAAWSHDATTLTAGTMHAEIGTWGLTGRERRHVVAVLPRLADATGVRPAAPAFAGVLVRTERTRGIGRPPTGREAPLAAPVRLARDMSDAVVQQATLGGCTVLRDDPAGAGVVPVAARTLALPMDVNHRAVAHRRVLLHIERTLVRALPAFADAPNVPATWTRVRDAVRDFLHAMAFRGAFKAATTQEGCFVKVDESTMSPDDVRAGRMHVLVGAALTTPAEFVLVRVVQQVVPPAA